jgi:hypothetical protein
VAGLSLNYWHRRAGFRGKSEIDKKRIWLLGNAGLEYYLGKKETTNGYSFRFGNYTCFYGTAGLSFHPFRRAGVYLTGGPVLDLYKGNATLGARINTGVNYSLGGSLILITSAAYLKHKDVNGLWALGLGLGWQFD